MLTSLSSPEGQRISQASCKISLSQSEMEIFIHTEQFARYISSGHMCADYQIISHLLEVDEGMTAAGQAALTDLSVRLALRLQIPEDVIIVTIIITMARVGGELGELQVRAGKKK